MIVYLAGPHSTGDIGANVHSAIKMADVVVKMGATPYIPHLCHLWHLVSPKSYEFWLEYDRKFLALCDCVLRLPGESAGADLEVAEAIATGKRVFYGMGEFINSCEVLNERT